MAEILDDAHLLAAALMWLRNHYDVGDVANDKLKKEVITRIDVLIDRNLPSGEDFQRLREFFKSEGLG